MRQSSYSPLMRITSLVVVITFAMLILEPTAVAAKVLHDEYQQSVADTAREKAAQLAQTLQTVETTLTELQAVLADDTQLAKLNLGQTQKTFKGLKQQVLDLDKQVQIDFDAVAKHIRAKKLPASILQRHQNTVTTYQQHLATMNANLEALIAAKNKGQLHDKTAKALKHLKPLQKQGKHPHFDPNNLPFNIPDGKKVRKPLEDEKELKKLFPAKPIKVAATTLLPEMFMVASAPDATYLQPTTDVQITPEIEALAQELEHNPVKIYNWTYNNIQFIPTYGSIQGSQMTLETKSGNATDTATLLIALLRASGIHSRYAHGTVRIPIEKVMNWVGGVTAPAAAIQILGQGGIPVAGLAQGGQIAFVKMEHVWVEAWVDFFPSRGAKHVTGDTWVSMDASFKQYEFTDGMDIQSNVLFDAEGFVDHIINTAQINETEGWITKIDQDFVKTTLQNYQAEAEAYLNQVNPNATATDVQGAQTILSVNRPVLATGLPYHLIARGSVFSEIPNNLRHSIEINLYNSEMDRIWESPALSYSVSLPNLKTKRLGITYEPASETDALALQSYHDSGATAIPLYLIYVKPVVKIDTVAVATSASIGMGESQYIDLTITAPWGVERVSHDVIAGSEMVLGVDSAGITPELVEARFNTVNSNTAAENLHQVALHYWMESDLFNKMLGKAGGVHSFRLPSVGLFSSPLTVDYLFGMPRNGFYQSRNADIRHVRMSVAGQTPEDFVTFVKQSGIYSSYLESSIFEQLFQRTQGSGISAVQLLMDAAAQQIPIYSIDQENASSILPRLVISPEAKTDIINSLNAGKIVIVSESEPRKVGWSGIGYIIQDPETGSGAYMISGGLNGGGLVECEPETVPLVQAVQLLIMTAIIIAILASLIYGLPVLVGAGVAAGGQVVTALKALMIGMGISVLAFPAYAASSQDCGCVFVREVHYSGPCKTCMYKCPGWGSLVTFPQAVDALCMPVGENGLVDTSLIQPPCRY